VLATAPLKVRGDWANGYTLDQHIESSEFLGHDGSGSELTPRRLCCFWRLLWLS
jgi:hypothetical protein